MLGTLRTRTRPLRHNQNVDEQRNARELRIERFLMVKSLGRNRVISVVRPLHTYGHIITITADRETPSARLADCCRLHSLRSVDGVALRAFFSLGEDRSYRVRICCAWMGRARAQITESAVMKRPNHALQRTRPSRRGCKRTPSWAGSLSLGR